ncbi:MAG: urea ABC transporter permease subunit UrtB [Gloeomargarita sp. SKYBB_i_bin120]|nr:urea ABC transporter permease subunit UrtB [Gloeomargarita sp. SKYB120]MDW8177362.1 urea ABC transporter permease subunit UrtB [Gloeomargarita sp. SKYBB_i_bin120]
MELLEAVFNGIATGSVLLLAALGLAITFGLMGVINMAQGEFMMLGAYTTFVVQNAFKNWGQPWQESYVFVALVAAFAVTALFGLFLERLVVRFLYDRPLETLLATWGVSLILQQFVRSVNWALVAGLAVFVLLFWGALGCLQWQRRRLPDWGKWVFLALAAAIGLTTMVVLGRQFGLAVNKPWFGAQNVDVTAPAWLRTGLRVSETLQLPYTRIFIIVLTTLCLVGVWLFLYRSPWGLRIRAVTQNRAMSACLGINTDHVDALTFALGSGLAGIAGCAVSFLGSVGPNTGQNYIVDMFMVVVVGGVGNLLGTILAALGIGTLNYLLGSGTIAALVQPLPGIYDFFNFFASTSMAKVLLFALIVAFLQYRPAGLFPQRGRMVES